MANMSYIRFENTYKDLLDCYEALQEDSELSEREEKHKNALIALCRDIIDEFDDN